MTNNTQDLSPSTMIMITKKNVKKNILILLRKRTNLKMIIPMIMKFIMKK